jgi:hypothetical protein
MAGSGHPPSVVIAGAGIAGLTAALYLLEAGFEVTVLERADHVGGKFGGAPGAHGADHEHAYHFLGDWCTNLLGIAHTIGLSSDDFVRSRGVSFLRPGHDLPLSRRLATLRLEALRTMFSENVYGGVIPPDDMVIWFYSLLDLITHGRDLDEKEFLNRISVNGFMRSLPYMTDRAALLHQEALMKAFSIPSYETSVRSYRQFARFFSRDQDGSVLSAPVHRRFWPAFTRALQAARGRPGGAPYSDLIRVNTAVEAIDVVPEGEGRARVSGIRVARRASGRRPADPQVTFLLLTVPAPDVVSIVQASPSLRRAAPGLLELRKLRSKQMASLDVYFKRPLPGVPREHVTLIDDDRFAAQGRYGSQRAESRRDTLALYGNRMASRFALSFVDNYQAWHGGSRKGTWLNVVSTDFEELADLDPGEARAQLLQELRRFVPFEPDDIDWRRTSLQPNRELPLFTNTVDSWQHRPLPGVYRDRLSGVEIGNLFLAGDYCQSEVNIVCLEGAVMTARMAARAIAAQAGREAHVPEPAVPAVVSDADVRRLQRDLEPWLRLAVQRRFGASRRLRRLDLGA